MLTLRSDQNLKVRGTGFTLTDMQFVADNWLWVVAIFGVLTAITTGDYLEHYGIGPLIRIRSFWLWLAIRLCFAASVGVAAFFYLTGR